ncbi:hypothetical protein BKA82DRAFT_3934104, partial [Pisolithus tinctorius]
YLANEDGSSGIASSHSFHHGLWVATKALKVQFEDGYGACRCIPFLEGFALDVVCRYDAKTESSDTVLISAHYDSRGSFGMERMSCDLYRCYWFPQTYSTSQITSRSNVEQVAFAGEEQCLLGSKAYTSMVELREKGVSITLIIRADMLVCHAPDERPRLG